MTERVPGKWCAGLGFEPAKAEPTVLQTVSFGRLDTDTNWRRAEDMLPTPCGAIGLRGRPGTLVRLTLPGGERRSRLAGLAAPAGFQPAPGLARFTLLEMADGGWS